MTESSDRWWDQLPLEALDDKQWEALSTSDIVIGVHGAGLANAIFMPLCAVRPQGFAHSAACAALPTKLPTRFATFLLPSSHCVACTWRAVDVFGVSMGPGRRLSRWQDVAF